MKIEANPDKIKAIMHTKPPQSRKVVQRLTNRIAAEQIHVKACSVKPTFLQSIKGLQQFCVGPMQQKAIDEHNGNEYKKESFVIILRCTECES
jgi:hypothetical protein